MDGCGSFIVSRGCIRVRKSLVATGASRPTVKFAIESDSECSLAVRVYDVLPDEFDSRLIDSNVGDYSNGWQPFDDRLTFSGVLAPNDSLVTAYAIRGSERDLRQFAAVPVIDTIQPVDPDIAENGETPLWRGSVSTNVIQPNGLVEETTTIGDGETFSTKQSLECFVAIPAYNEGGSIARVVGQAREHADAVMVIDDGSADDTAVRAREAGAEVVTHKRNKGYGGALKTAFEEAHRRGADHLVILDGDGQHDPADIPRLVAHQRTQNAEIVIGSRYLGDRENTIPLYRRIGLWTVNFMTNLSMGSVRSGTRVRDTQCGFRTYDREAIRSLATDDTLGDHMGASTDILYHARRNGFVIDEVGTTVSYDVENGSSHNPLSHGLVLISNILRTIEREHPIASLGLPGTLSTFVGFSFAYWAIANFVQSGVFSIGLTMMAVFFTLAGIFACFTSIMLHALNQFAPPN